MRKNLIIVSALIIVLVLALAVLVPGRTPVAPSEKFEVAASFYPVYFLSARIGGEKATVTNITPAGAEPHDYEPTPQQLASIERSRLIVLNGGMEAWGERVAQGLDPAKTVLVEAGKGLETRIFEEEGETMADPHVWLSPALAARMTDAIVAGFVQADPENAAYYEGNAAALKADLAALDAAYKEGLASCEKTAFVTSHAAFGYLAESYGLSQIAIAGLSPEAEPTAKELANVASFAREHGVDVIFFETLVSPKLSETIAREVGARTLVLDPIEGLTDDERAQGSDYLTLMRRNLANLQTALRCTAR